MNFDQTSVVQPLAAVRANARSFDPRSVWNRNLGREHGFQPLRVEGTLPEDLRGTSYRNGPGIFSAFGQHVTHTFEADGALSAIRFDGTTAQGAVRVTQSSALKEERAAGRVLYGPNASLLRRMSNAAARRVKNAANTNVISWQGRVFTLFEAGRPTEIAPADLATLGSTDLDRVVVSMFSAHPHRVAAHRTLYNFGLSYGRNQTQVHLYALPDDGPARRLGTFKLPGYVLLHDFIATEKHMVFFVSPVRLKPWRALLQLGTLVDLIDWRPEYGTEIVCVPFAQPDRPLRFQVESFFQWHFANAFERGGSIFVDYVRFPSINDTLNAAGGRPYAMDDSMGRLHRAQIDPQRRQLSSEVRLDTAVEFPTVAPDVDGATHRYAWLSSLALDRVLKLDVDSGKAVQYELPAHQSGSEPIFVPRRGASAEDDGHVLVMCSDSRQERAFMAVFDAQDLASGPRAKVWFDHYIPTPFHGTWVQA